MEADSTTITIHDLMCNEDEDCLFERSNGLMKVLILGLKLTEEYVEMLIGREAGTGDGDVGFKGFGFDSDPSDGCLEKSSNWDVAAHLDAVNWMSNVRALFGFQFSTVYLAMTYFDQFISVRPIDNGKHWAIRLISIACLSVAAKMEEFHVPVLSDYPSGDYMFENSAIQRVELSVLSTLEWKMAPVMPFVYFGYFSDKLCVDCESKPKNQLFVKATQLVMDMLLQGTNLMSCRPSSIAAAAILVALDFQLTDKALEAKLGLIQLSRPLKNEEVLSLYSVMEEMETKKCKTPELDILPSWSLRRSPAVDEKFVSPTLNGGTKRRLFDNDNDKDNEISSKKMVQ
ncbi:unnamed protein product [Rhodiola kirilowii]